MRPAYGCVVLTMGRRPDDLRRGLESVLVQRDVDVDVVVVGNGWDPTGLPPGVRAVALPDNVGIPAGRNAGIPHVGGDLLLFLDDDASLAGDDVLARGAALFAADPTLGIVCLRVADPTGTPTPRRQVPRLRAGDPQRSSDVTTFWEGAVLVRRAVLDRAGPFPAEFFYAHEGTDLAWRAMDAGFRVHYRGDLVAAHRVVPPTRHGYYHYLSARNRVWLARRHLPWPFLAVYPTVWFALTLLRLRDPGAARDVVRGYRDGLRQPCGPRRPLRWSTVWRMTQAGRPPVI